MRGMPKDAVLIYESCLNIKVNYLGKEINYVIPENKLARIYGLNDGEILIRSKIGLPILRGKKHFRGFCVEIKAKKGRNSLWPFELFRHTSPLSSKNAVYVVGKDIFIKSLVGKKLHKIFEYSDGTGTRQ